MASFKVREASYGDIPQIARMFAETFRDDTLIGDIIHPYRQQHPEGMELWFLRGARIGYFDYRSRWLVSVFTDTLGSELIAGCTQWRRVGPSPMDLWWFDPRE